METPPPVKAMKGFESNIDIHEFFIEGRDAESSQVILHITEPANPEENGRGYLFMVAEANQASYKTIEALNRWIEELETGFYDETLRNKDIAVHFEHLLERINKKSDTLLKQIEANEEEIHIVVGFVNETTLSFAVRGEPLGFVAYSKKSGDYSAMAIIEGGSTEDDEQLFNNIISGDIHPGDRVLFCTPHVEDGFTSKQITNLISGKPPKKSTKQFQNTLEDVDNGFSFGGLLLERNAPTPETKTKKSNKNKPVESLSNLLTTARNTEETLAPSVLGRLRSKLEERKSSRESSSDSYSNRTKQQAKAAAKGALHTSARYSRIGAVVTGKWVWSLLKWLFVATVTVVQTIFYVITNLGGRRSEFVDHWKRMFTNAWETTSERFGKLSMLNKIVMSSGVVLLIIFFISVSVLKYNKTQEIKRAAYQAQVSLIESKLSAAESNLIFNEEDRTREIIDDVITRMENLTADSRDEKETIARLAVRIDDLKEKIRHAEHVGTSLLINTIEYRLNEPQHVRLTTGLVIVNDNEGNLLARERGTEITATETLGGQLVPFATDEDLVFFIDGANESALQWKYTADDEFYEFDIPGAGAITDSLVYNDRLYTLVAEQNQIFKHGRHQEGFGSGTQWAKGTPDLANAINFTIDGLIWTLNNDGSVNQYAKGEKQEYTLGGIDPSFESATRIWTMFESKWLYIFDPAEKRIAVFNKEDGKLQVQYIFDDLESLRDFAIDERKNIGLILAGTELRQFELGHITQEE